jgi:GDPmannose 4,6-dehydratase
VYAYWITVNYREAYNMFACNGILFNHESPLRGETFVTRKITRAAARIKLGLQDCLYLGNLDAQRDWGHARDYVRAMWLMLQQDTPEDYVIASGEAHSVREFVEKSFGELAIPIVWEGQGLEEVGRDARSGKILVRIDPRYFRPTEVDFLLGDPTKAREKLGWKPEADFDTLVREMIQTDLKEADRDNLCQKAGFSVLNHNE